MVMLMVQIKMAITMAITMAMTVTVAMTTMVHTLAVMMVTMIMATLFHNGCALRCSSLSSRPNRHSLKKSALLCAESSSSLHRLFRGLIQPNVGDWHCPLLWLLLWCRLWFRLWFRLWCRLWSRGERFFRINIFVDEELVAVLNRFVIHQDWNHDCLLRRIITILAYGDCQCGLQCANVQVRFFLITGGPHQPVWDNEFLLERIRDLSGLGADAAATTIA